MAGHLREFACALSAPDTGFGGTAAVTLGFGRLWFSVEVNGGHEIKEASILASDPARPLRINLVDQPRGVESPIVYGWLTSPELKDFDEGAGRGRSFHLAVVTGAQVLGGKLREVGARTE